MGSTCRRSPALRPLLLPPARKLRGTEVKVAPWSDDARNVALPSQLVVYMPATMYSLLVLLGSMAMVSMPMWCQLDGAVQSLSGIHVLVAEL